MNQSRKANREVVLEEAKCKRHEDSKKTRRHEDFEYIGKLWKKSLANAGVAEEMAYFVETAEEAHRKLNKEQQKAYRANNNFGWNQFNADTMYKAHEKRVNAAFGRQQRKRKHETVDEGENASEAAPAGSLDKMSEELKERKVIRARFSRRRQVYDEEDVNFINERNRGFNKKLDRAYDKFTVETRQNLERGTAL